MRWLGLASLLFASLGLSGCANSLQSQQPPAKWTTGFWFWNGSSAKIVLPETLDVLFLQAGTIRKDRDRQANEFWNAFGDLPNQLPAAREYWLVFRFDNQGVPDLQAAPILAGQLYQLRESARQRHINVVGVQLDIDSPTGALSRYAAFLRAVRKAMPPDFQISITALLDWFRESTAIAGVIQETDEFVPQFYDVAEPNRYDGGSAIAAKFDAAQWAPRFDRFKKRFRIGISTFGRARFVPAEGPLQPGSRNLVFFNDVAPLDIAGNSAFHLETNRSEANELVLNYRATRQIQIGYNRFHIGDTVQFILPTPDAIHAAVESARRMRGYCAGVVFFRWPASNETLALQPDEILLAAGLASQKQTKPTEIHAVQGGCVAVNCADLFLISANPFSPHSLRYRIRSSAELEYFLPQESMPVRMLDSSDLELSLPPYSGRGRMYLGRAVTATRAEFIVEEEP
jgi:hypothetical protein